MIALRPVVMLFVASSYAALAGWDLLRRPLAGRAWSWLLFYCAAGCAWAALDAADSAGWLSGWLGDIPAHVPLYAAFSLGILLLYLTRQFLRARLLATHGYWLGAFWLAAMLLLDSNMLRLAPVVPTWPGWVVDRLALTRAGLVVGWSVYTANAVLLTIQVYRRTQQPLHRNRQAYWSVSLSLTVVAMAVTLIGQSVAGSLVLLAAGFVMALGLLTHELLDVRQVMRQVVSLTVVTGLSVGIYTVAILAAPWLQYWFPGLPGLLAAVGLAVMVVALANPGISLVQRRLERWATGANYDAQLMVGKYSLTIGNIVDLDLLATVALDLIHEAIGNQRGVLFIVDPPASDRDEAQFYGLRAAGALGNGPQNGALLVDSPIATHFKQEYAALTQYELDLNARFQQVAASERVWLQSMAMDVYVPIYASRQWIGLFALGPKASRHRYFDPDLRLLSTLADQTAVALQNARLVDDLKRLNTRIQDANNALDAANQSLAHLDRIKSDFINVISHELRTPLSILYGYAQILLDDVGVNGDDYHRQLVEGINTGTTRMQEIIENMLDVTKIDSRALVLSSTPVSIEIIVSQILISLRRPLAERQLSVESRSLADLPPVEGDPAALSKVFHHLVVNAVKFTPDGGHITVSGRCLDNALPGGALEIAIDDTGIGIDPRFLDLIFTKFYQMGEVALHSSGKTKFKGGGPGLGLAIAKGIVEAHGGRLRAESSGHDEDRLPGSRFLVLLPLKQSGPGTARPPAH